MFPDFSNVIDPTNDFLWIFICIFNSMDCNTPLLLLSHEFIQHQICLCSFGLIQSGFIQHLQSEQFFFIIRSGHLQESIYFSHCSYIFGNEGLQLCLDLYLFRLESSDVLEQFLYFLIDVQVVVILWVIISCLYFS